MLHRLSTSLLVVVPMGMVLSTVMSRPAIAQTDLKQSPPAVATVLPANTPGLLLVNTATDVWQEIDRFNPLPPQFKVPFQVPFFPTAIDFATDIQPWLGDRVGVAFLPAATATETVDSSTVLLAPIRDTSRFNAFLAKLKATKGQPEIERDYKGVTILQWSLPSSAIERPAPPTPETEAPGETSSRSSNRSQHSLFKTPAAVQSTESIKAVKPKLAPPTIEIPEPLPTAPIPDATPPKRNLVIAVLPGNLAIAAQAQALEKLIDAQTNLTPLAQNPQFLRTIRHSHFGRSLAVGYTDVAGAAKFLKPFAALASQYPFPLPLQIPNSTQLETLAKVYSGADTYIWLQPEGIHSQVNFYYTTPRPAAATIATPNANQILSRVPAITYLSANSRNFKQQWQTFTESDHNPNSAALVTNIRNSARQLTGLDWDKDIIPWMDGEYAFFMFPAHGGLLTYLYPKLYLGLGMVIQTSDRPAAAAALKKIDQSFRKTVGKQGGVVTRRINGQPVVSWEGRDKGKLLSVLSYSWVDQNTLIITTGAQAIAALTPKPYLPLGENYTFKTATASFPQPNEGYFYVNMGASLSLLYSLILPAVPPTYSPFVQEVQRILGTVRSLSTSNSATAEAQRVDGLWVLGPVNR